MTTIVDTETGEITEALSMDEQSEVVAIAKRLRNKAKGEKQPCYICGKHGLIAERHHIIPVAELALYIHRSQLSKVNYLTVWLCPNHHAYWHALEACTSKAGRISIFATMTDDERLKLLEILERKLQFRREANGAASE